MGIKSICKKNCGARGFASAKLKIGLTNLNRDFETGQIYLTVNMITYQQNDDLLRQQQQVRKALSSQRSNTD
jgi:hypothetical protein